MRYRDAELRALFKYQVAVMLSGVMWEAVPVVIAVVCALPREHRPCRKSARTAH
jgi:hypothetical protein